MKRGELKKKLNISLSKNIFLFSRSAVLGTKYLILRISSNGWVTCLFVQIETINSNNLHMYDRTHFKNQYIKIYIQSCELLLILLNFIFTKV